MIKKIRSASGVGPGIECPDGLGTNTKKSSGVMVVFLRWIWFTQCLDLSKQWLYPF